MSNSRIWIDVKYKKLYIMKVEIADPLKELFSHKETYRSGHNGAHSKCVCPPGHEGSNPSVSAGFRRFGGGLFFVSSTKNSTKSILTINSIICPYWRPSPYIARIDSYWLHYLSYVFPFILLVDDSYCVLQVQWQASLNMLWCIL